MVCPHSHLGIDDKVPDPWSTSCAGHMVDRDCGLKNLLAVSPVPVVEIWVHWGILGKMNVGLRPLQDMEHEHGDIPFNELPASNVND